MSTLQLNQTHHDFTITSVKPVQEIDGTAYTMHHAASAAELLYLDTAADDMGFAIGFRTHPADNTGVFHIIEHSVLCGSDKYPVKEPFVHLLKSSMKTFLNAATSTDCTLYPVASTNERDLMNLMSVYLDAVFHPAILREPRIFKQEGWHYEYDGEALSINGVVYNEMKGMLAQPAKVLANALNEELFPNTSYRFEAGGVPGEIETLTYEQFIDTYKRHYKPNNAAIVLYGSLDIDTFLAAIDQQLTTAADGQNSPATGEPNPRGMQDPVISTSRKVHMETPSEDAQLKLGTVFADPGDTRRALAMRILGQALLGTNESPLTRMLLDTGIAQRITFNVECASQRFLTISAHNVKPNSGETLLNTLRNGCKQLLAERLDKGMLKAAAFEVEFDKRSNQTKGNPTAEQQMMACLSHWGSGNPLSADAICYDADFAFLESAIETDYFDRLLREAILESNHYALVELCPVDKSQANSDALNNQLQPSDFSNQDLERIAREAADLKDFQSAPDSPEALSTLPHLDRAECLKAPRRPYYKPVDEDGLRFLRHEYAQDGIAHIIRYYDISTLTLEDYLYVDTLNWLISETDTLRHSAAEIVQLKSGRLGAINAGITAEANDKNDTLGAYVWVYTCSLASDIEFASSYVDEILHETVFKDRKKLREIIEQQCSIRKHVVTEAASNVIAQRRADAHFLTAAVLDDATMGVRGLEFIKELKERCEDDAEIDKVLRRLEILCARVYGSRPALVSFSGDEDCYRRYMNAEQSAIPAYEARAAQFLADLSDAERGSQDQPSLAEIEPISCGDEAFVIPGNVAYCATTIDVSEIASRRSGYWSIANSAASLDYLWNNVRVKGGAYGTDFTETRRGMASFNSFRDPNIDSTLACFDRLGTWLSEFNPTDEEMDGYVVSAIASFDAPRKGFLQLFLQSKSHLFGWTLDDRARQRQETASCTVDDVRRLGGELIACSEKRCSVVFASREMIEQSEHEFMVRELG